MKRFLLAATFLLSTFLGFSQHATRDSVLNSKKFVTVVDTTAQFNDFNGTITLTLSDTGLVHATILKVSDLDSSEIKVKVNQYVGDYTALDGFYFYYDAILENNNAPILFCVKFNWEGTFNSFGLKLDESTIIAFYVAYDDKL